MERDISTLTERLETILDGRQQVVHRYCPEQSAQPRPNEVRLMRLTHAGQHKDYKVERKEWVAATQKGPDAPGFVDEHHWRTEFMIHSDRGVNYPVIAGRERRASLDGGTLTSKITGAPDEWPIPLGEIREKLEALLDQFPKKES